MEAVITPVETRFRCAKRFVLVAFCVSLSSYVARGAWLILFSDDIPTRSVVLDGTVSRGTQSTWGTFPVIVLVAQNADFEGVTFGNPFGATFGEGYPEDVLDLASITVHGKRKIVINVTQAPIFKSDEWMGGFAPPTVNVLINFTSPNRQFTLCVAPRDGRKKQCYFDVLFPDALTSKSIVVKKGYRPKNGRFWGFPWQDDHIEERIYLQDGATVVWREQHKSLKNFGYFQFKILNPTVTKVEAISVVAQFVSLLAKVGGFLTICTSLFFIAFVRKYPISTVEQQSQMRTLRGWAQSQRLETERWVEEEGKEHFEEHVVSRASSESDSESRDT